jgi:hypothetical protein
VRCELIHNGSNVRIAMVHMPALNTPQFSWVNSRLPRKPQPVPPIYEPEVAAEAIVWAAHHDRREIYVGSSTTLAILGHKIAPEILDHYLGRTGYDAQQHDGPADPKRPNNLWEPLRRDHGAHGDFDNRASDHNVQLWLDTKRTWLLLAGLGLGAAIYEGVKRAGADRREELRKAALKVSCVCPRKRNHLIQPLVLTHR